MIEMSQKLKRGFLIGGWLILVCWAVLLSGCGWFGWGSDVKNISAAKPEVATKAMSQAGQQKNREAIVPLVKRLYDEDPAIRLSAIKALKNITGEDMGYRSYEPEVDRIAAIKRWETWMIKEGLEE